NGGPHAKQHPGPDARARGASLGRAAGSLRRDRRRAHPHPEQTVLAATECRVPRSEQASDGGGDAVDAGEHESHDDVTTKPEPAPAHGEVDDAGEPTTTTYLADIKLTKLAIPELQERYRQTLQRETRSTSAAYLVW